MARPSSAASRPTACSARGSSALTASGSPTTTSGCSPTPARAVAHNPGSNLRLGCGIAPGARDARPRARGRPGHRRLGVRRQPEPVRGAPDRVGRQHDPLPARDDSLARRAHGHGTWRRPAARASSASRATLGRDRAGTEGRPRPARADSVFLRPLADPLNTLVYAETGASVETVLVDGRVVVEHGRVTTVDADRIYARAQEAADRQRGEERRGLGPGGRARAPRGRRLPGRRRHAAPDQSVRRAHSFARVIRLDDVEKTYRTRRGDLVHAVEDMSVSIRENEFVTLVGPERLRQEHAAQARGRARAADARQRPRPRPAGPRAVPRRGLRVPAARPPAVAHRVRQRHLLDRDARPRRRGSTGRRPPISSS